MSKYICLVCGFIYEEEKGSPDFGINPNTKWEDLPNNWVCPWCGAPKSDFEKEEIKEKEKIVETSKVKFEGDMTALEMSALFSNLSRGFEKSYKFKEQELCKEISEYYKNKSENIEGTYDDLINLVNEDLKSFSNLKEISKNDRGALRALVWSEKVTKIINSILSRFNEINIKENDIYVCTICGFVYVGNDLVEICPVCKVPNWKFEKIGVR